MTIYFISGLGADERAFQNLRLPPNWEIVHIQWQQTSPKETIPGYAKKLATEINTQSPFTLVGLSFGGIVAVEIAKLIKPQKLILISSIATDAELPKKYKWIGKSRLHKVVPLYFFKHPTAFTYWFFGMRKESEKKLLKNILASTEGDFLLWAIDKILNWKNIERPMPLLHLHGDHDRLLPVQCVNADIIIKNAGHLMVYTHADEVSRYIVDYIENSS